MSKIIVHNDIEGLEDTIAMTYVKKVIDMGKVSTGTYGEQYCHMATFGENGKVAVTCDARRTGTFSFRVWEYQRPTNGN